jgi:hypothetical protein
MEIRPKVTGIPPLDGTGSPNREFELRLTKGPIAIGEPGDGTYAELYSKDYLVFLDETGRLKVFVSTGGAWAPVSEELYPQPPHPGDQIRHIGACFDQAARLVLAYEFNQQVYVYQWDPVTQRYVTRGPFPGVDPVVIQDATIGFYPPDSDVLLLHLSTDRTRLIMRVQRQLYNTPHEVAVFPRPVLLDQANAFPYYGQVVGSYVDSPDNTGFAVLTDMYPVYLFETAASPVVSAPVDWDYIFAPPWILKDLGTEVAALASVIAPTAWDYIFEPPPSPLITKDLGAEVAGVASVAAPTTWDYIFEPPLPPWILKDLGTEVAASVSVAAPTNWNYLLARVVYNGGVEVAASASVTAPTDWNYYV